MYNKTSIKIPPFMEQPSKKNYLSSKAEKNRRHGTCSCQCAPKNRFLTAIGVLVLVLAYTAMGSIMFVRLEGDEDDVRDETSVAASKPYPREEVKTAEIRSRTVERLWSITEDLNILYKENWTRLAAQEVQVFQDTLVRAVRSTKYQQNVIQTAVKPHKWTYASSFLYSLTLMTTIGYGNISPKTQWGRIAALLYALFGIPIILLYLSAMGEGLSSAMRFLFQRIRPVSLSNSSSSTSSSTCKIPPPPHEFLDDEIRKNQNRFNEKNLNRKNQNYSSRVPISICVMMLICYVTLGAVLFNKIQPWGVLESLYFCFSSLGTIGFGDLLPKGDLAQYLASGYIIIGMAFVAMCFTLIQTEIIVLLQKFGITQHHNNLLQSPIIEDLPLVTVSMSTKS